MKEIKFRVWDKDKKIMVDWNNIKIGLVSGYNGCPVQTYNFYDLDNSQHLVFMQYTGLKDKNGKEIYEGDRVRHTYGFGKGTGVVIYLAPEFMLEDDSDGICSEFLGRMGVPIEVIGNIWEVEK